MTYLALPYRTKVSTMESGKQVNAPRRSIRR